VAASDLDQQHLRGVREGLQGSEGHRRGRDRSHFAQRTVLEPDRREAAPADLRRRRPHVPERALPRPAHARQLALA
jgi:hypothetical protein